MPNQVVPRFLFDAKAVGVGDGLEAWASAALPLIGGEAYAEAGPIVRPSFKFQFAETTLIGRQVGEKEFETIATVTVRGLNILDVMKCDLATVTVRTKHILGKPGATTDLSPLHPFTNLVINDDGYDDVALNIKMAKAAASDFKQFDEAIKGKPNHYKHKSGAIFTTLALENSGKSRLDSNGKEHGFVKINNDDRIKRIYLCEWSADSERRSLTLMRVVLTDGRQIIIGDPDDNGRDYP